MAGDLGWPTSPDFWRSYAGQLTPLGCEQLIRVGKEMRAYYLGAEEDTSGELGGLLEGVPCEQAGLHVVAYCSNYQRTLFSAWSFLHGLMPRVPRHFCSRSERVLLDHQQVMRRYYGSAGSGSTMGIPIVVQDSKKDGLLRQWETGPLAKKFKEWQKSNTVRAALLQQVVEDPAKDGAGLADKLHRMTGMENLAREGGRTLQERLKALRNVQTQVEIARAHGMAVIPNEAGEELSPDELRIIDEVAQEQKRHWFHPAESSDGGPREEDKGTQAAGNLAHFIWWHMERMADGTKAWRGGDATKSPSRGKSAFSIPSAPSGSPAHDLNRMLSAPVVRGHSTQSAGSGLGQQDEDSRRRPKRVVLFSGHDTTIMALAARLGFNLRPPKFGGYLLFELHEGKRVECKYNQDPFRTPLSALTSKQLPQEGANGIVDFDDLPDGHTHLPSMKARCQIKALKMAARRLPMLERVGSWSVLNSGLGSQPVGNSSVDQSGNSSPASIAAASCPPTNSFGSVSSSCEGRRANAERLLQEMDPEARSRAEDAFRHMDPHDTGYVSVEDLASCANMLGVEISPAALQLAAECFADEGQSKFARQRFLELMALLDQAYVDLES